MLDFLNSPNGANYVKADLHIHTPVDKNFKLNGLNCSSEKEKLAVVEKYVEQFKSRDLKIVAITEHNDVTWLEMIRRVAENEGIVVFPGVEISTNNGKRGIHILALFDPSFPTERLDHMLTAAGLPPHKRLDNGNVLLSSLTANEVIKVVNEYGGICIAAHSVDNNSGLFKGCEGDTCAEIYTNPDLLAVEIPGGREELAAGIKNIINGKDPQYKNRDIACLNSSDARSIDAIGSRFTYIKLSSFTIEGLKQAFLDWRSRIRLPVEKTDFYFPKILGVKWEGGAFLGGSGIHFNNNLNCLIGGKGTGKSFVLETIRYAFGQEPIGKDHKNAFNSLLRDVFKPGSKITVAVEDEHGTKYFIERTYPYGPVVSNSSGEVIPGLAPGDVFAPEIFGQKEIYEISRHEDFQLSLMDSFYRKELDNLEEEERLILKLLRENHVNIEKTSDIICRVEARLSELPRLQETIKRLKQYRVADKFAEKKAYDKEKILFERVQQEIEQCLRNLEAVKSELEINPEIIQAADLEKLPNAQLLSEVKTLLANLNKGIASTLAGLERQIVHSKQEVEGIKNRWKQLFDRQEEKYNELLRELQARNTPFDPHEYVATEEKITKLLPLNQELEKYREQLRQLKIFREVKLTELQENRRKQHSVRVDKVRELSEKLAGVLKISVEYEGCKEFLVDHMSQLKTKIPREVLRNLVTRDDFNLFEFVKTIRLGPEKVTEKYNLSPGYSQNLCRLDETELFALETYKVLDRITIELNVGGKNPVYKAIDKLSIGQKCTAILTLILLKNKMPLLIDQPEDDLDNKFVYDEIVKTLRKEKEKRQFIIATHNANIPVLGDAEQIIVLQASNDKGQVSITGSIDDNQIKEPVEQILEGGKQAFQLRKQKYGF
ncbi:TrlF family AAA-like ATPase [Thermincola potens]|uniref:Phosphoesterase PHP domain protein n=1 Tax=Thermincola potens (strain JR) TaxID=635013 RepID=D5XE73_THEPJ|nr:AAA family ATPase [Thermincola potens]ADG81944.1 phosphoesterase PHP domain protein [Thermincola potens JR]